ncbi:MAP kinase-like protein, partial [Aureobasidium melanogenum]
THLDAKKNNMVEALKREIGLLRELKHPNIVQYLGSNSDDSHLNIFLEYVAGGSVATMLVNYGSLGEPLIANFVRQILSGLAYLHSKDIIHRDIKGANILVDNHGSVKISDFGISKRVEASSLLVPPTGKRTGPRVSLQGSVFWMAPEVVKQTAYTRKADIWSLGCLIVEMFT